LVLLDIGLPGKSGVEMLKMIRAERPETAVLVLSSYPEDQYALRVLKHGASGYLTKESAPELLLSAIRRIAAGGKYVSPAVTDKLVEGIGGEGRSLLHEALSDREFEVFKLLAAGKSPTEIAALMYLSIKTVSTYRARILGKTGLKTNADLTRYALQQGLIQ
jgi:two-component system, NarL family, invasion response regulator UvrY